MGQTLADSYIKGLPEVKFWYDANQHLGEGIPLPADGSVIDSSNNLPIDLISGDPLSYVAASTNTATFRTNPSRIEFISNDVTPTPGNSGQVSIYYSLPSPIQSDVFVVWLVSSFLDNPNTTLPANRKQLFAFNNATTYTLSRESNTGSYYNGTFYFVPKLGVLSTGLGSGSKLFSDSLFINRGMVRQTVYKIISDGTNITSYSNFVLGVDYLNTPLPTITLSSIDFGKRNISSGDGCYSKVQECIYIDTNDLVITDRIDSYFKTKYNV